jgi:hypothetical protein
VGVGGANAPVRALGVGRTFSELLVFEWTCAGGISEELPPALLLSCGAADGTPVELPPRPLPCPDALLIRCVWKKVYHN